MRGGPWSGLGWVDESRYGANFQCAGVMGE